MRYTVLFILLFLLLVIFSCSRSEQGPVEEEHYFAELYVRFLEEEGHFKATATFFEGDSLSTAVSWQPSSPVLFNDRPMEERNIQGNLVRYIIDFYGQPIQASYRFSLTDQREKPLQFDSKLDAIRAFTVQEGASKQKGLRIKVQNGQLKEGQSLVFLFSDSNNQAYSITIPGPQGEDTYFLSPQRIADWPAGKGQLYLVKKSSTTKVIEAWNVLTETEYYTKTQEITIN